MRNLQRIDVDIASYDDRLASDVFHFMAESDEGKNIGFGTDPKPEKALIKAISECVERKVMRSAGGPGSNGFAAHNSPENAAAKALLECKERDAFLLSWLSRRSPKWIDFYQCDLSAETIKLIAPLSKDPFQVQFGLVAISASDTVVVGTLRPSAGNESKFGVVFSSACSSTIENAITGTALELRRAATVILNREETGAGIYGKNNGNPTDGRSTFEHYLNPKFANDLRFYFEDIHEPLDLDFPQPAFTNYECEVNDPRMKIFVAQCVAQETQGLFFGLPDNRKICATRFKQAGLNPVNYLVMPLP